MADYFTNYACTYCQEKVSGIMIKCVQCKNFDLCLQCFAAGAEIGPHKNDHPYKFFHSGAITISVFPNANWTAREHIRLLDAVEYYGYGNFEDIAKAVSKKPEEAKKEYISRFINGNIGKMTWPSSSSRPNIPNKTDPSEPSLETAKTPILDISKEEAALLGYMPQRNEFDWEYDYSAESQISSLYINNPDDELEVALKLAQVDMYIRRLRERTRRKRVANDFHLISKFFEPTRKNKSARKNLKKKEFYDRMRVFTQFHTSHEHEQFLQNLAREQELRLRCAELLRYRQNGITKLEECFHFEQIRQEHDEWKEKRSDSSGYVHLLQALALKKRKRSGPVLPLRNGNSRMRRPHFADNTSTSTNNNQERGGSSLVEREITSNGGDGDEASEEEQSEAITKPLSSQPGYQLLSQHEIKLCSSLHLTPSQFITLKTVLISDHQLKNLNIKSEDADSNNYNENEKHLKNYFKNSGWLLKS